MMNIFWFEIASYDQPARASQMLFNSPRNLSNVIFEKNSKFPRNFTLEFIYE